MARYTVTVHYLDPATNEQRSEAVDHTVEVPPDFLQELTRRAKIRLNRPLVVVEGTTHVVVPPHRITGIVIEPKPED